MIDTSTLKVGDKFFSPIPIYRLRFFSNWKVKECEVVKVNKKSLLISFDADSRKYPHRIPKEEAQAFNFKEIDVWRGLLSFTINKKKREYPDENVEIKCEKNIKSNHT